MMQFFQLLNFVYFTIVSFSTVSDSFTVTTITPVAQRNQRCQNVHAQQQYTIQSKCGSLYSTSSEIVEQDNDNNDDGVIDVELSKLSDEEKKEVVGNLVADDEWNGMAMELSELIKTAVIEDMKSKGREFLGKDEYQIGDISKQIDITVKENIAQFRGKDNYELGDFVLAIDEVSKDLTSQLTGKPYETGDLSKEIDKRIKQSVATYCGKDTYETGDLTKAITSTVSTRVTEFIDSNYEFGDISREINNRRQVWVKEFLGEDAYNNYQFGDVTKKLFTKFTGKDEYQFGDVSKKLFGSMFGNKKKE